MLRPRFFSAFTTFTTLTALLTLLFTLTQTVSASSNQQIILPTSNHHIYGGDAEGDLFYMYCHRVFEGKASRPWTAGKYGFVRTLRRTADGVIGTHFHEGIDIKPLKRDRRSNPLDLIHSISDGTVAYVNPYAGNSNYGKYIVVKHKWDCGPIFSLYAHLTRTDVKTGDRVKQGQVIGKMGYTGRGISRERAHVHLELAIMLSSRFQAWYDKYYTSKNRHGLLSGFNLCGLDVAEFFLAQKKNPNLTLPEFLATQPVYYKVTVPRKGPLDIVTRYPWLARGNYAEPTPSWEISFTASGFPLAVSPSKRKVTAPRVTAVKKVLSKHEYHTKRYLSGTGHRATLTAAGKRYIALVTGDF